MCVYFLTVIYFFNNLKWEISVSCFTGINALALLYLTVFCKNWGLHVRRLGVCRYGFIHGYPRKICGYGYGYKWEISYPRQAWN